MPYPISEIQGIGTDVAAILKSDGIRTTVTLLRLAKTPKLAVHRSSQLAWPAAVTKTAQGTISPSAHPVLASLEAVARILAAENHQQLLERKRG